MADLMALAYFDFARPDGASPGKPAVEHVGYVFRRVNPGLGTVVYLDGDGNPSDTALEIVYAAHFATAEMYLDAFKKRHLAAGKTYVLSLARVIHLWDGRHGRFRIVEV